MSEWKEFLSTIPIFSFLTRDELKEIQEYFAEENFQKGDVVCRAGDPGDKFYVVLSGELEVWGGDTEQRRTGTLVARDFFGEMALLQGGKRTATIIASRRTRTLSLDKASFDRFFLKNPKALEYFARVLSKRLASVTRGDTGRVRKLVISVAGRKGLKGKTLVSRALGCLLKDLTAAPVLVLEVYPREEGSGDTTDDLFRDELEALPAELRRKLTSGDPAHPTFLSLGVRREKPIQYYAERAANFIGKLDDLFTFIIIDHDSDVPELIRSADQFSDVFIEITDTPEGEWAPLMEKNTRTVRVINLWNPSSRRLPISRCEPYVLPAASELTTAEGLARLRSEPTLPVAVPLWRLARKLLGASVGVALGGGAAFGISHLGVLKVLQENRIPIDLVAGCSQGSIIGVGFAAGISVDEMIAIACRLGQKRNFLMAMDFTLLGPGFLAGNRVLEIFNPYLRGKETFEDLVYPYQAIATDIESGERVAISEGRLDLAFRASSSVPMVFAPLKAGERALVDGGVADPVPAGTVQEMGADLCIAVNVVPPLRKGVTTVMNQAYKQLNRLNPLSYLGANQDLPNMFDIVMNSLQILQYELGNFKAISADVLINPDLSDFTWIEYYRSQELIERGIEAAEKALPAIEKVLRDRLSPFRPPVEAEVETAVGG